jgi:hypothetical protein
MENTLNLILFLHSGRLRLLGYLTERLVQLQRVESSEDSFVEVVVGWQDKVDVERIGWR